MRKITGLLLAALFLFSCNNNKKDDTNGKQPDSPAVNNNNPNQPPPPAENLLPKMLGSYVGSFGDNKITMLIIKAEGDSVLGRSIVGGNDRPFAGTVTENAGVYTVTAKEPGDDKNDGVFTFYFKKDSTNQVSGSWKPNDSKKPSKDYVLERKQFEYKADVGEYPQDSQRLLKAKDVENMFKEDLAYMRNEIFARHGYCFKKKDMRQMFEMEDWYVPNTVDIKGLLSDIEKKNIELIKRYEKYAEEYGDEYGR